MITPLRLQQLLSALGDTGSSLYVTAVRQAKLDALLCAIVTCALIATIVLLAKKTVNWHKNATLENDNAVFVLISCVLIVLLVPITYVFAYETIVYLTNPQWAIYETIAGLMR